MLMYEDTPSVDFHSKIAENNYIIILSSTISHGTCVSSQCPGPLNTRQQDNGEPSVG